MFSYGSDCMMYDIDDLNYMYHCGVDLSVFDDNITIEDLEKYERYKREEDII